MPTGQEEQEPQEEEGGYVFCIFPAVGPESFNWIPCCVPGKWAGLFNDYLRVICFLLLLALDAVIAWMDPYRCGGPRRKHALLQPATSMSGWVRRTFQKLHRHGCWHLASLHLLFPFIKDRHVDNNQFCSTAPWLLCSIHPELSIMPIHGGDNETCVSSMTFINVVVWWLVPQLCRVVTRDLLGH